MQTILQVADLGVRAYGPTFELQKRLVGRRRNDEIPDTLLLVEHSPVYTLGIKADSRNVTISESERQRQGIELVQTDRGGDVTYHGPGQLVGYPILSLGGKTREVVAYVGNLERVLIGVLGDYGIQATTDRKNRGVWVGDRKIAALGVRVTGGVTLHGFALNVTTNLEPYKGIIACGIRDKGITSLHLLVPGVKMEDVKRRVVEHFTRVFGYEEVRRVRSDDLEADGHR